MEKCTSHRLVFLDQCFLCRRCGAVWRLGNTGRGIAVSAHVHTAFPLRSAARLDGPWSAEPQIIPAAPSPA